MAAEIPTTGNTLGNTLSGVANLAQLFLGSTTTSTQNDNRTSTTTNSGGTTTVTSETSTSPEAVSALVNSILSGTQGLAAVAGGQRTAGLYGSSTNQLLVNDLAARAAAEGAKLNQRTTQTTVTPQTTQTTANAGGTTTTAVKEAAINPGIALGGLGILQAIPTSIKDRVLGLTGLGRTASAAAASSAVEDSVADFTRLDSNALAESLTGGASTATDGLAQSVASSFDYGGGLDGNAADYAAQDIAGYNLSDSSDTSSDVMGDAFSGLDGSSISDVLGGFISGIGDVASSAVDSVGNFFDDFDFGFADGGAVKKSDFHAKVAAHREAKGRVHMANGGSASMVSDLADLSTLTNTGLTQRAGSLYQASGVGSNDQVVSRILKDTANNLQVARNPNAGTAANAAAQIVGYNSTAGDTSVGGGEATAAGGDPNAAVSGIAGTLGVSQGIGKAGLSGLMAGLGINAPGLSSLANARTSSEATKAAAIAALTILSPPLGMAASLASSLLGGSSSSDTGTATSAEAESESFGQVGDISVSADQSGIDGNSGASGGGAGSSGGVGGDTNGSGIAGSSADGSYKSGGSVKGPGTGTSDSIPAMLSDGEYVIPADMAAAIGIDKLDALRAILHKPTKTGA